MSLLGWQATISLVALTVLALRLWRWWARHARPIRRTGWRSSPRRAALKAIGWFPWISIAVVALLTRSWFGLYDTHVRLPPDLPASEGWVLEANVPMTDGLVYRGRYLRWRVPEPVASTDSLVATWVATRGPWWYSRAAAADHARRYSPTPTRVKSCSGTHEPSIRADVIPFMGVPEPPPPPASRGVHCLHGKTGTADHSEIARVTPLDSGGCTVELWLAMESNL